MKKNIVVTGVAGFIGSQIAKALLSDGHRVFGIDNLKTGYAENIPEGVEAIFADCADQGLHQNVLLKGVEIDVIVHFAGQSSGEISFDDPIQDLSDNCVSTLNLLKLALRVGCTKFLFASSMSVYGAFDGSMANECSGTCLLYTSDAADE